MAMSIMQPPSPSPPPPPPPPGCAARIRLVYADGGVHDFTESISAREVLQSSLLQQQKQQQQQHHQGFNNFLVCDSLSLRINKRACPMHPDTQLEVGHLYYVLPIRTFQHRLAWSHISSLAAMASPSSSPSAAIIHMSSYHKSSLSSKRGSVACTLARIANARFHLRFCFRRRLLPFGGRNRVDEADVVFRRAAAATAAAASSLPPLQTEGEGTRTFNNICDNPEMNSKYVEHLIDRSKSWRPPLLTIQESLAVV